MLQLRLTPTVEELKNMFKNIYVSLILIDLRPHLWTNLWFIYLQRTSVYWIDTFLNIDPKTYNYSMKNIFSLILFRFKLKVSRKTLAQCRKSDKLSPRWSGVNYSKDLSTCNKSLPKCWRRRLRVLPRLLPNNGHFTTCMCGQAVLKSYVLYVRFGKRSLLHVFSNF